MIDWKIKKFDKKDIDKLFDWRKLVSKREKTREYFYWEYLKGNVETLIADYKGEIVGQYSAQRYEALFLGEKIKASLSFDTGTHPGFRKQGIFHTLGKCFFEREGEQDVHFSTGFPNENFWTTGKGKFGWNGICKIPLYVKDISLNSIGLLGTALHSFGKIDNFNFEFDGFSESFEDDIPIYLNRTRDYLNWRFADKPNLKDVNYDYSKYKIYDRRGVLVSYIVLKIYNKELQLVDFLIPNDECLYNDILWFFTWKAKTLGLNKLSLYINSHNPFCKFLQRKGFRFIDTNRVYIVRANNNYLDKDILLDEKNYYITMGDCDVI